MSTGLPMNFVVERNGRDVSLTATPRVTVVDQGVLGKRRMGHLGLASSGDPKNVMVERCGLPTCVVWGVGQEWFIVKATTAYIVGVFAGRESTDQVSGLIGAAQMAGEMAKISMWELFSLAAWFSVSVGFMNLLPIPLLDGGHLVFYACEAVLGRPLSDRMQEIGLRIGIAWWRFWLCSQPPTTSFASCRAAINQKSTIFPCRLGNAVGKCCRHAE